MFLYGTCNFSRLARQVWRFGCQYRCLGHFSFLICDSFPRRALCVRKQDRTHGCWCNSQSVSKVSQSSKPQLHRYPSAVDVSILICSKVTQSMNPSIRTIMKEIMLAFRLLIRLREFLCYYHSSLWFAACCYLHSRTSYFVKTFHDLSVCIRVQDIFGPVRHANSYAFFQTKCLWSCYSKLIDQDEFVGVWYYSPEFHRHSPFVAWFLILNARITISLYKIKQQFDHFSL